MTAQITPAGRGICQDCEGEVDLVRINGGRRLTAVHVVGVHPGPSGDCIGSLSREWTETEPEP